MYGECTLKLHISVALKDYIQINFAPRPKRSSCFFHVNRLLLAVLFTITILNPRLMACEAMAIVTVPLSTAMLYATPVAAAQSGGGLGW